MRFALLPLFAILIAGMISCSNADEQIAEIQCPGATEGEFITVTVPPPEADDTGWTHPDELLRYKAAILFYQDMEELRCPASRMQHRDSATESSIELLTEAATVCDLTINEIIRRINNEAEARRAATDPRDLHIRDAPRHFVYGSRIPRIVPLVREVTTAPAPRPAARRPIPVCFCAWERSRRRQPFYSTLHNQRRARAAKCRSAAARSGPRKPTAVGRGHTGCTTRTRTRRRRSAVALLRGPAGWRRSARALCTYAHIDIPRLLSICARIE